MAGHSLLQRIKSPELCAPRRVVSDADVRQSVLENLRAMCGTRVRSAPSCPDYGILSVTDIVHSCPHAIDEVIRSLLHTVRTFEPRLSSVVVRHVGEGGLSASLTLEFEIDAQLDNAGRKAPVRFRTVIDATRRVRVD